MASADNVNLDIPLGMTSRRSRFFAVRTQGGTPPSCRPVCAVAARTEFSIHLRQEDCALYMALELQEMVLEFALVALHIVGCNKVDHVAVLSLVSHTPNLESVNEHRGYHPRAHPACSAPFPPVPRTSRPGQRPPPPPSSPPASPTSPRLLSVLSSSSSRHRRRRRRAQRATRGTALLLHGPSLKTLALVDCAPGTTDTPPVLCGGCARLEFAVPVRDWTLFDTALAPHTHARAVRPALMASVPRLCTVVSAGRGGRRLLALSFASGFNSVLGRFQRRTGTGTAASAGKAGIYMQIFLVEKCALHPRRVLVLRGTYKLFKISPLAKFLRAWKY
ncbi:hypothetical protein FB451DRAFT_1495580 [Mycena latifolia]|nr:hypothetical protein FB451DRAFT_1495580 [Mycena latifolia]